MIYLIVSLLFFVLGFAAASYLFQRHYRNYIFQFQEQESLLLNKELELKESKEALQEIMYLSHHQGTSPRSKRIRGLTGLGFMVVARLFNYLELLSKPNHQEYSRLAMAENKELLKYLKLIESEALQLEQDAMDKVKKFEDMQ